MRAGMTVLFVTYLGWFAVSAYALEVNVPVHAKYSEDTNNGIKNSRDNESQYSQILPHEVERELSNLRRLKQNFPDDPQDVFLPRHFDARKKWKRCAKLMETIWDQGNCRSSSVVAVTAMAADRLCIASEGKIQSNLSAQHLMACSSSCEVDEPISTPLEYLQEEGIPTGSPYSADSSYQSGCVPFEVKPCEHVTNLTETSLEPCNYTGEYVSFSCPENCTNSAYSKLLEDDKHKMKCIYEIDENEEKKMKREILSHGPIVAGFVLFEDFLNYEKGIYHHKGYGPYIRIQTVKLIGWGVEKKVPYWLGVNSFGERWGMNGLFKFYRGKNHLFIETMVASGRF